MPRTASVAGRLSSRSRVGRSPSTTPRLVAALCAAAMTLAFLAALQSPHMRAMAVPARMAPAVGVRLIEPAARRAVQAESGRSSATVNRPSRRSAAFATPPPAALPSPATAPMSAPVWPPARAAPDAAALPVAEPAQPTATATATAPDAAASRPGALDLRLSRAARQSSAGAVRGMAGAARVSLADARPTPQSTLASTIRDAAKPDCLGPDEHGSLLALVLIPIAVATDKCR